MENKFVKRIYFDDMNYSAGYLQPKELEGLIESHYKRPIVKIKSTKQRKAIYRKIRGKSIEGLTKEFIGLDNISLKELNVQDGDSVSLEKANLFHRYVTYYRRNPNEELRGAWWYFIVGFFLSLSSIIISLIGI
jgi:hypothetical protein